jgi:predicted dehydrogenase
MSKKIKWGILGCGRIARKFADDLSLSKTGYLHACASRERENVQNFANKYGAVKMFTNYEDLVNCREIDAIYIATPHSHHFEHAVLCLNAKKAVLCEKPLTVNQYLTDQLFAIAKQNKVLLMEAMWTAFLPAIIAVKNEIEKGTIGQVRHLTADFGFKGSYDPKGRLYDKNLAGGSLLDIGIYPLFISLYLLGIPENLYASGHIIETGVDDECSILLQYSNRATASLYSTVSMMTDTKCEIFGTQGKILIPGRFHEQSCYFLETENGSQKVDTGKSGHGYYHEIEHFNQCLLNNKPESNIMTYKMSQNLAKLMDLTRKQIGLTYPWD